MVKDPRIEVYGFTPAQLTADANGNISVYSSPYQALNGEIIKVGYKPGNIATDGSIAIAISGTSELIWKKLNNLDTVQVAYPMVYAVDNANVTGSPQSYTRRAVGGYDAVLWIWGSGLGAGKSGLGLQVWYR